MHLANKDWLIALTAFAGPGLGNGLTYFLSLWLINRKDIQSKTWVYYFFFWWHVHSIGNFIDYVPSRTFASHGDMTSLAHGLHISPWYLMTVLGYIVLGVIWHFFSRTLPNTYKNLNLEHKSMQTLFLTIVTVVLLGLYSTDGMYGYGKISHFISTLSLWFIPPTIAFNLPWRQWVSDKVK